MPYRELSMLEVREVLRRYADGDGLRAIARGTGLDRKTVAKYITAGTACGLHPGGAPPTDAQVATVVAQLQGPMPGRPGTTQEVLHPHQGQIQAWLTEGLRLTKIYRRLRAQGVAVSYSTLYRFAQTACGFGTPTVTVRVADPPPGEAAEVDFGVLGLWTDPATGTRRRVYGLLVTLCHSRYACLAVSLRQDLGALLDGLELAWTFFGGVVRRLVLDNLTPAVTKADRYTPTLGKVFLEYAQYRGFVVDPTVPVHPTGKPKVERGIPYAREDFFRGETFRDLAEMQTRALTWCRELAGTRLHGTTRQIPRVVFETAGARDAAPARPDALRPADLEPGHGPSRSPRPVPAGPVLGADPVRRPARGRPGRHSPGADLRPPGPHQDASPPGPRAAVHGLRRLPRGPDALCACAPPTAASPRARRSGPPSASSSRSCSAASSPGRASGRRRPLLRLAARFGAARVNAACARALAFDLVDVRRVQRILQHALEHEPAAPDARGRASPCRPASRGPRRRSFTLSLRGGVPWR